TLASNAGACDAARQLVPESMRAMVAAGMFRIPAPVRVGGYELPLRTLADAVIGLSEACSSSGWVLMVMGAHHFCLGHFPETAQDAVFSGGADGLVAGTLAWQGSATPVGGGYRVAGRWQFCSGVDHADWVMLGCADARTGAPLVHVVVPRSQIMVDDTWRVMGLQGTGSKDVVAEGIFVPVERSVDTRAMMTGSSPYARKHSTNLYRVAAESMLSLSVATAVLGIARRALVRFVERTLERRSIPSGGSKSEYAPTQIRLAESAAEIRSAELTIGDALALLEQVAAGSAIANIEYRARVKWQAAYSAELCRRSVERLFAGSGAHGVYLSNSLQALLRDVQVGAQHASIDFDSAAESYGKMRLSRPGTIK
ncbi:MAG TPA: acyl-CoA dehydrogenase family protein, partial [Candidatus Binataceae bacterium]